MTEDCHLANNGAVRIDAQASRIEVSVADLIESGSRGSLGFGQRGGYERMWIGQAIHTRYQEQQLHDDPSYQSEVGIKSTVVIRGWEVTVRGRIDGLRQEDDGTVMVQELKSVRRDRPPSEATLAMYREQAAVYAWMLSQEQSQARNAEVDPAEVDAEETNLRLESAKFDAELVLIEVASYEALIEPLELNLSEVDTWIRKRLQRMVGQAQQAQAERDTRARAGRHLVFPHDQTRPGQEAIIEATERAIEQQEHLLIEAPTGLGKTVAALYPAVKAALEDDLKVYVLTAKNLQQEMALKVMEMLNVEESFSSLQVRAKARMCANDEIVCHEDYCRFARDYFGKLHASGLVDQLADGSTVRPDAVFDAASQLEVCPFEVSLELARRCHTVIGDYNYAFDPYVSLRDFGPEGNLEDSILIIDEIHNLVERARGYWSPEISSHALRTAAKFVALQGNTGAAISHLIHQIAARIEESVDFAFEDHSPQVQETQGELAVNAFALLRPDFDDAFLDHLESMRASKAMTADDPIRDQYYGFQRFMDTAHEADDQTFATVFRRDGEDRRIQILCLDPSRFLKRIFERARAVIGLSATLSPPEFYRDLLGFDQDRWAFEKVESPFPEENRRVVIDDEVSTLWRDRPDNYGLIAERLGDFASAVPGNVLALFPSYQFLAEVASRIHIDGKRIVVQEQANSAKDRDRLLDTLRDGTGNVLLLAVAGGVFAEGVDYPGEMLKAVAVVGPALPPVSLERELLKRYFQEQFERGFEYSFVLPGMTRVVQAAGRLIRSDTDTGVIALFGHRFKRAPYATYLPQDWLPEEGPVGLVASPGEVAGSFFQGGCEGETEEAN